MALYVNTNISSINAQRKLMNATNSLNTSYQRLSSGLRINSAKDDAAGLLISDRLTSQINGLNQGNRNANDGIALAQTVEGALDETSNMLQRIRVLAVQSANGTNTNEDRLALQKEVDHLSREISRIARKTTFAGAQILDGAPATTAENNLLTSAGQLTFQLGANANDTILLHLSLGFAMSGIAADADVDTALGAYAFNTLNAEGDEAKTQGFSLSSQENAQSTLRVIDAFIQYVDSKRADLGAIQNRMESTIRNQSAGAENQSDARSRIRDTDFASETANLTQNNIIQQASQSILAQANQRPTVALNLLGQ